LLSSLPNENYKKKMISVDWKLFKIKDELVKIKSIILDFYEFARFRVHMPTGPLASTVLHQTL
jgi:hypothetical protein